MVISIVDRRAKSRDFVQLFIAEDGLLVSSNSWIAFSSTAKSIHELHETTRRCGIQSPVSLCMLQLCHNVSYKSAHK
jgi:7-keto-8-aminopelargonate synthetase-like enzyme